MFSVQRFLFNRHQEQVRQRDLKIQKRIFRDGSDPFGLPNRRFTQLFRLNKNLVHHLFQSLVPHMDESLRNIRVPPQLRILTALRFFATGNYQRGTGEEYLLAVSQQVVSRVITEVANVIELHLAPVWISFPTSDERKRQIKIGFMERAQFPGIIGCIDCTHVAIVAPVEEAHNYMNRKGFFSKNVQVICDHNLEILNVHARFPGSVHDSAIWRTSRIKFHFEGLYNRGEINCWLLGDSGYPSQPWLLTPIAGNPDPDTPDGRYNHAHKLIRSDVERCIALLKLRFRCILRDRRLKYQPDKVGKIVNACAVLHNMCVRAGVELPIEERLYNHDFFIFNNGNDNEHPELNDGRQVRQQVIHRYFA